jgi:hypothetical protein
MHDELAVAVDIAGGVFGAKIGLALQPEHDQRRIFGEDIEEAERCGVDGPVFVKRRHQGDRTRHHDAAEQLVSVMRLKIVKRDSGHHVSGGGTAPVRLVIRP